MKLNKIEVPVELEEAPAGYFTCNEDGLIINANSTFLNLLNQKKEDVINKKHFTDFLSVGGKMYYETHYAPLLQMHGSVKEVSLELINTDKKKIPILINSVTEKFDGKPIIRSSVFEITQRRLFESELIAAKKQAEDLSLQLTEANEKLKEQAEFITQQNHSLDKLNKIKDKYFGIIAHDMRSPLQNIKSFIYLLDEHMDDFDKNEISKMIDGLKVSVDNTIDLANDLVTWGQGQMKQLEGTEEELLLEDVFKNIVSIHIERAKKKNLDLTYRVADGLKLRFDKYQLSFILRNLLVNAIKFTPKGGNISIEAINVDDKVKIIVTDSGIGMKKGQVDILFSTQEMSTKGTEGEKGSGLGLSMVYEFIKMNNGSVEVESELGEGTRFTLTFPSHRQK